MAITYPLNNISFDAAGAELFHCTRTSGVWAGDEDFSISASGADNNVTISSGLAWIRNAKFSGKVVAQKTDATMNVGLSDPTYPRIDAIVLQFSANKNSTDLIIKKGTASFAPVPPERIQTESLYELHLYHIRRNPGAASVSMDDITDLRADEKWCGIMYDDVTPKGSLGFIKATEKGKAGGVATLGGDGKVPTNQLPPMNYIPTSQKGAYNGVCELNGSMIPSGRIPALSYISTSEKGASNGVATLVGGKVPADQLPPMNYIPTSQKGAAGGVASLDGTGKVPENQIPGGTTTELPAISLKDGSDASITVSGYKLGKVVVLKMEGTVKGNSTSYSVKISNIHYPLPANGSKKQSGFVLLSYHDLTADNVFSRVAMAEIWKYGSEIMIRISLVAGTITGAREDPEIYGTIVYFAE